MHEKMGNVIIEVYEILLRFAVFLVASLGVTSIMAADGLTGLLWVRMYNIVWGLLLADIGLLATIPFFSPRVLVRCIVRIMIFLEEYEPDEEDKIEKSVANGVIPPDDIIRSAERILGKLLKSDVDVVVSTAVKTAYDGLQTAVAMLDDPETTQVLNGKAINKKPLSDKQLKELSEGGMITVPGTKNDGQPTEYELLEAVTMEGK